MPYQLGKGEKIERFFYYLKKNFVYRRGGTILQNSKKTESRPGRLIIKPHYTSIDDMTHRLTSRRRRCCSTTSPSPTPSTPPTPSCTRAQTQHRNTTNNSQQLDQKNLKTQPVVTAKIRNLIYSVTIIILTALKTVYII